MKSFNTIFSFKDLAILSKEYEILATLDAGGTVEIDFNIEMAELRGQGSMLLDEIEPSNIATPLKIETEGYNQALVQLLTGSNIYSVDTSQELNFVIQNIKETNNFIDHGSAHSINLDQFAVHPSFEQRSRVDGAYLFKANRLNDPKSITVETIYSGMQYPISTHFNWAEDSTIVLKNNQGERVFTFNCGTRTPLSTDSAILKVFPEGESTFEANIGQEIIEIPEVRVFARSKGMMAAQWTALEINCAVLHDVKFSLNDEVSKLIINGVGLLDPDLGRVYQLTGYQESNRLF